MLDECHHLLEVWGRLLAELLDVLPDAVVLGLTATPPETLTPPQQVLVDELFGPIVYSTSIPAVVREGHLAPFADLVWLTTPDPAEAAWLDAGAERFAELTTDLLDPTFGSTPFLTWLDQRFTALPWRDLVVAERELCDAALRMQHAGLLRLPADARGGEQHERPPDADDWVRLVDDWYRFSIAPGAVDPGGGGEPRARDERAAAALRRALPSVGYRLTKNGIRRHRTSVDRVLARSASKSHALVQIVAAEHRALGDRLAMLVVCDHEQAAATLSADLDGVLVEAAGSARLALATLLADPGTRPLGPILVTGRTVAGAPEALEALLLRVAATDPALAERIDVGPPDGDGIAELAGAWTSRQWVRAVTEHFGAGDCRVLVGTRALLGEGWDAPRASGLVDLSTATTSTAVVQTRGRTLRLDPADPAKVAVNWTVCCVSDAHPRGDNDWQRVVRKHEGYFGVDAAGEVVDGVAHLHPSFSPFRPPPTDSFDAVNAAMLVRAERRDDVREAWRVGEPYDDVVRQAVWLRPVGGRRVAEAAEDVAVPRPQPPAVRLTAGGLRSTGRIPVWDRLALWGSGGLAAGGLGVLPLVPPVGIVALAVAVGAALLSTGRAARRRRALLATLDDPPDLLRVAGAVADGLAAAGLTSVGSGAVTWLPTPDGRLRIVLQAPTRAESEVFATALADAVGPVAEPRYLVPRHVPGSRSAWRPLAGVRPASAVWHAVPTLLGANADRARAFAGAWERWVGGSPAVYTGNPEGAGLLAASRDSSPLASDAVLRLDWS